MHRSLGTLYKVVPSHAPRFPGARWLGIVGNDTGRPVSTSTIPSHVPRIPAPRTSPKHALQNKLLEAELMDMSAHASRRGLSAGGGTTVGTGGSWDVTPSVASPDSLANFA